MTLLEVMLYFVLKMKPHQHLKVNVGIGTKKSYSDSANFLILFLAIDPQYKSKINCM